jgi:hypothetical protein
VQLRTWPESFGHALDSSHDVFPPSADAFSAAGRLLATLANREAWTADDTVATSRHRGLRGGHGGGDVGYAEDRVVHWVVGNALALCARNSGQAPALASATVAPKRMMISVAGLTTRSISFKPNAAS